MKNFYIFAPILIIISFFLIFMNMNHILMILIIMEITSLSILSMIALSISNSSLPSFSFLIFLLMMVSESILGMSLMILMSFSHGNDNIFSSEILNW